jgi:hypothetical protein
MLVAEGVSRDDGLEVVLDASPAADAGPRRETGELALRGADRPAGEGARLSEAAKLGSIAEPAADAGPAADRGWTPPAVPPPAYTLRAPAERWEPKPLTEADYEAARAAADRLTAAGPEETGKIALPPRVIFGESAIDIDTAINTRRAAGH